MGRAAVPSGASTGAHEAVELRDGDKSRWGGKGVRKAVEAVNGEIAEAVVGHRSRGPGRDRRGADRARRHREQGAARRQRHPRGQPRGRQGGGGRARAAALPLCRRGRRQSAAGADDEHPQRRRPRRQRDRFPGIHGHAGRRADFRRGAALRRRDLPHAQERAARGGAIDRRSATKAASRPSSTSPREALDFIMGAVENAGYKPGEDVVLALDCAASEFFRDGGYEIEGRGEDASPGGNGRLLADLAAAYPIASIEDGMAEDDLEGWKALTEQLGDTRPAGRRRSVRHQPEAARHGHRRGHRQFDPDQGQPDRHADRDVDAVGWRRRAGYTAVMSHRSGETEDRPSPTSRSRTNCGQIKTGSLARSDRTAKYNQLLRIEEELGDSARYPGRAAAQGLSC